MLSQYWGPYPAPQAGGIFVRGDVPFSLETYTRPIYTEGVDLATIAHENGHQWWGDNVSVKRWRDICLNECFASYSMYLWLEDDTGLDLDGWYLENVADDRTSSTLRCTTWEPATSSTSTASTSRARSCARAAQQDR